MKTKSRNLVGLALCIAFINTVALAQIVVGTVPAGTAPDDFHIVFGNWRGLDPVPILDPWGPGTPDPASPGTFNWSGPPLLAGTILTLKNYAEATPPTPLSVTVEEAYFTTRGVNVGDGSIVGSVLAPVPEPAGAALSGAMVLLALAAIRLRRRTARS